MTTFASMSCYSNCCTASAVAGTSMRINDILDTAILAVSIIVVRLIDRLILAE